MKISKRKKYRKAVFMVTYYLEKNKIFYVLQYRKLHWKGWEFPKGGVEKFEFERKAIRREIAEEVGLPIKRISSHKLNGKYKYPKELKDRPGIVGQTYKLYSVEVEKGKIKFDQKEHSSSKWATYQEAIKKLTHKEQKESLKIVDDWLKERLNK